mgnify:CR=1 FL=1
MLKPNFDIDRIATREINGVNYVCLDYISINRQKHVRNHIGRDGSKFLHIPCECGSGEQKEYVEKSHLKKLLEDYGTV